MGDIGGVIGAASDILADPYLNEVVCRVGQLKSIDRGETPAACNETPDDPSQTGGIGLRRAVPALRAYVYSQEHVWVLPTIIAVAIGLPMWIGYEIAKGQAAK
jgi:hypothetical protein